MPFFIHPCTCCWWTETIHLITRYLLAGALSTTTAANNRFNVTTTSPQSNARISCRVSKFRKPGGGGAFSVVVIIITNSNLINNTVLEWWCFLGIELSHQSLVKVRPASYRWWCDDAWWWWMMITELILRDNFEKRLPWFYTIRTVIHKLITITIIISPTTAMQLPSNAHFATQLNCNITSLVGRCM